MCIWLKIINSEDKVSPRLIKPVFMAIEDVAVDDDIHDFSNT